MTGRKLSNTGLSIEAQSIAPLQKRFGMANIVPQWFETPAWKCRTPAPARSIIYGQRWLERQLETELNETRVVHRGADRTKSWSGYIRNAKAAIGVWRRKLRVVEEVENFCPEI
jgi:hypothetical protein